MAGARSFERGEDYFVNGQVEAMTENKGTITAKVRGTYPYRVKLWIENEDLDYSCTCPMGADGEFCKHCVAVGLMWIKNREQKTSEKGQSVPAVTMDDVRAHLLGQDKNTLLEMLVEHAMEDDRLRQRLLMKTAKKDSRQLDVSSYRRALDEAVELDGFVDYRSAYQYASGVEEVIDSV